MILKSFGFLGTLGGSIRGGNLHPILNNLLTESGAFFLTEDGGYLLLD